jgi:hypothetical protein
MKSSIYRKRFFKAQRERNRMHSLNKALDVLRKRLQKSLSVDLRLPKIEALRLGEHFFLCEFFKQQSKTTRSAHF